MATVNRIFFFIPDVFRAGTKAWTGADYFNSLGNECWLDGKREFSEERGSGARRISFTSSSFFSIPCYWPGCRYFNQPALIVASVCQHLVEERSARAHELHDDTTKSVASCRARLSNEVLVTVAVVAEEAVSCLSKIGFRERKSYEKWRIVASLN